MEEILRGVRRFQLEIFPERKTFFRDLAQGQRPQALLITCSDSRIDPALITQISPGTLFIIRNAGNIVSANSSPPSDMSASLEYAVSVLNVRHIIVCGHTHCGAMEGLMYPDSVKSLHHVSRWLDQAASIRSKLAADRNATSAELVARAARANVVLQLDNLRSYPWIAAREADDRVSLHGWVYDIEHGEMYIHQPARGEFAALSQMSLDGEAAVAAMAQNLRSGLRQEASA
jgi:carbonic anhydrase